MKFVLVALFIWTFKTSSLPQLYFCKDNLKNLKTDESQF